MKSLKTLIIVAAIFLVALVAWSSCTYTVNSDEYAVVKQFGKVVSIQDTTGLKFKAPFVQSVEKLPKKQLIYDLSATYPDLKERIFGAMQRLPLPEWGPKGRYKRPKDEN